MAQSSQYKRNGLNGFISAVCATTDGFLKSLFVLAALAGALWSAAATADGDFAQKGPFSVQSSFLSNDQASIGRIGDSARSAADAAALEGARRKTALLIDGAYDFNYDEEADGPLRPYLSGGVGLAATSSPDSANMAAAPVARLGGGVAYKLDQGWNLALDYKAGVAGKTTADPDLFTGRSQRPIDMQSLNLGMKYKF
jgi:opacity protein-like surface antigen